MSPTPTNPTTTPIDCAEPGCTWAVRGVPDKYARIMAMDHAAEHAGQASSTATETAVDRVPLRDRIRRAVCEAEGFAWDTDMLEPDEYGEVADAVLAVLPAPAADRATVLRAAADAVLDIIGTDARMPQTISGVYRAADHLRRLADKAQQDTGEAHPAEHTWAAELHDPLADEWIPGRRYVTRARAVNDLEHARKITPKWKDGAPTERRLVRATTTYTVEQPAPAVTEEPTT